MRYSEKILIEDILKHIFKYEQDRRSPTLESISGALQIPPEEAGRLVSRLAARGLLVLDGESFRLTDAGRGYALQVIRAHRLWERYLADETGYAESDWHKLAEEKEHSLSPNETDNLAAQMGHPLRDPHGDPIPGREGKYIPHGGIALNSLDVGQSARIVHLEDEPPSVYDRIVAAALYPGMLLKLEESGPERVRFRAAGISYTLESIVARNISVIPITQSEDTPRQERLSALSRGERAVITRILPTCRGAERRRFIDLGILPGTVVTAELESPGGGTSAYLIRQALIALRKEQADQIEILRQAVME